MSSPSESQAISDALAAIDAHMRSIVASDASAYEDARAIWSTALGNAAQSPDTMWPLWLIWGALTDVVETQPQRLSEAEATMRRAAREWLALPTGDVAAREQYLQRWVYAELGYERPAQ
jgi:hypothetical protein